MLIFVLLPVGGDPGGVEARLPLQRRVHPGRVKKKPVFFNQPSGFFGFFGGFLVLFFGFFIYLPRRESFQGFFSFKNSDFKL
jgi:hypothetical protein